MIHKIGVILILLFQTSIFSCVQENDNSKINGVILFQEKIVYPYIVSEKRRTAILKNMNKLEKGMTKESVIELMTFPDEANFTYETIKNKSNKDNISGFSLVYMLNREMEKGSVKEKNEKLIRIHFNDSEKLIWSYSENIDGFTNIAKE